MDTPLLKSDVWLVFKFILSVFEHVSYTKRELCCPQNTCASEFGELNVNDSTEQLFLKKNVKFNFFYFLINLVTLHLIACLLYTLWLLSYWVN
jgi:hypothetical protein